MSHGYFITGTDTGVGKTLISCALLHAFNNRGLTTTAMKPVASGCVQSASGWHNDDALQLKQAASLVVEYQEVNPYALAPAIAPHLAARYSGITIDNDRILTISSRLAAQSDVLIVEGVGGWLVPLNEKQTMAELASLMGLPVILVVAIRLGCLNHALLSAQAINNTANVRLAGWVANIISADAPCGIADNSAASAERLLADNIMTLQQTLDAPLLGSIPYRQNATARQCAGLLDIDLLQKGL